MVGSDELFTKVIFLYDVLVRAKYWPLVFEIGLN
jgi:hypothetical protein